MGKQRLEDPRVPNPLILFEPPPPIAAAHALSSNSTSAAVRSAVCSAAQPFPELTASFPLAALSEAIFPWDLVRYAAQFSAAQRLPELTAPVRSDFGKTS